MTPPPGPVSEVGPYADLRRALSGVTMVPITPFDTRTGVPSYTSFKVIIERAETAGIHAVTVLGNTAEPFQLTYSEQQNLVKAGAEYVQSAKLIAGASGALDDVVKFAAMCRSLGYAAIMLHEPQDPLASGPGRVEYIQKVATESELPVILYVRSNQLSRYELGELVLHPKIIAVKYARTDLVDLATLLSKEETREACTWICGLAEAYFPNFKALGVTGFTSGLANVRPDLSYALWDAARDRDEKRFESVYSLILPFEIMRGIGSGRLNVSVIKAALLLLGEDVGSVRPPCVAVDDSERAEIAALLSLWAKSPSSA